MSAPLRPIDDARARHLAFARRARHGQLSSADHARYRVLHRQLLRDLLSGPGRVVLLLEEFEAAEVSGGVLQDLPRAIAQGRAWWVSRTDGGPLLCEGASADDVLASLARLTDGAAAPDHPGGATAWARARGWEVQQLAGVVG